MAELAKGKWHRLTIVADLAENTYDVFADGEQVGKAEYFYDHRWFQGADEFAFFSDEVLIDNLTVHHLPGKARPKSQG